MEALRDGSAYPTLDGIQEDKRTAQIISPAYADRGSELTAILQYVYQSFIFEGLGFDKYAKTLEEIALAEMMHLDILGSVLYRLGVLPVYTSCPPKKFDFYTTAAVCYENEPQKMIMADIKGETEAIRAYEKMLTKLQNEQVSAIISRIILDEKLHLATLKAILIELN